MVKLIVETLMGTRAEVFRYHLLQKVNEKQCLYVFPAENVNQNVDFHFNEKNVANLIHKHEDVKNIQDTNSFFLSFRKRAPGPSFSLGGITNPSNPWNAARPQDGILDTPLTQTPCQNLADRSVVENYPETVMTQLLSTV